MESEFLHQKSVGSQRGDPGKLGAEYPDLGAGLSWWLRYRLWSQTDLGLSPQSGSTGCGTWGGPFVLCELEFVMEVMRMPAYL